LDDGPMQCQIGLGHPRIVAGGARRLQRIEGALDPSLPALVLAAAGQPCRQAFEAGAKRVDLPRVLGRERGHHPPAERHLLDKALDRKLAEGRAHRASTDAEFGCELALHQLVASLEMAGNELLAEEVGCLMVEAEADDAVFGRWGGFGWHGKSMSGSP